MTAFSKANRIWRISPNGDEDLLYLWVLSSTISIGNYGSGDGKGLDLTGKKLAEIASFFGQKRMGGGGARQVYDFIKEMKIGDVVIIYFDKAIWNVAVVTSEYIYETRNFWAFIEKRYDERNLKKKLVETGVPEKGLPNALEILRNPNYDWPNFRKVDYLMDFGEIYIEVESQEKLFRKLVRNAAFFDITEFRGEIQKLVVENIKKEEGD